MAASWDGCFLKWLLREMAVSWDGCFLRCLLLTFSLCKTPFGETGCLDNLCFCLLVAYASSFLIHPTQSVRLPMVITPHCAAPVWLTGHYTVPLVTRCFPPNPYLGKQRISLGVAIILSICLCSHTWLDCNQFSIILNSYLYVSMLQNFYVWWKFW